MFFTDLTVLRLNTTVWGKMWENSFLREFCAQISKTVFLADLTVLRLWYNCMSKNVTSFITPRVLCTNITNRVVSWFDRFTASYYGMSKNGRKLISPRVCCSSITNRVLSWFDRFTAYYYSENKKFHKTHISTSFMHKCHKSRPFLIWPFYGLIQLFEKKCRKIHISTSCVLKYQKSCP